MSDDDWDIDEPSTSTPAPSAPAPVPKVAAKKWAGEDEDDDNDDWDVSDTESKKSATKPSTAAPVKKKMTLKQKLAEKERLAAENKGKEGYDDLIDGRTEQDRRREARERELEADLAVASDLMGDLEVSTGDALKAVLSAKPTTKADFNELSNNIIIAITSRHESNPLYSTFLEQFTKDLCANLNAVQTRKISSALSVLGNTKQQEERDKASGKKKASGKAKPNLGQSAKATGKLDLDAYDDVLEDDDFM